MKIVLKVSSEQKTMIREGKKKWIAQTEVHEWRRSLHKKVMSREDQDKKDSKDRRSWVEKVIT